MAESEKGLAWAAFEVALGDRPVSEATEDEARVAASRAGLSSAQQSYVVSRFLANAMQQPTAIKEPVAGEGKAKKDKDKDKDKDKKHRHSSHRSHSKGRKEDGSAEKKEHKKKKDSAKQLSKGEESSSGPSRSPSPGAVSAGSPPTSAGEGGAAAPQPTATKLAEAQDAAVKQHMLEQETAQQALTLQFQQQIQAQKQQHNQQQQQLQSQLEAQKNQLLQSLQQQMMQILQQYQQQPPNVISQVQAQLQQQALQQQQFLGQQQQQQMQKLLYVQQQQVQQLAEQQNQMLAEHQRLMKEKLERLIVEIQAADPSSSAGAQSEAQQQPGALPVQDEIALPTNDSQPQQQPDAQRFSSSPDPSKTDYQQPEFSSGKRVTGLAGSPSLQQEGLPGDQQQQHETGIQQTDEQEPPTLTPEQQQQLAQLREQKEKAAADLDILKQQYTQLVQNLQLQLVQLDQTAKQHLAGQQAQVNQQLMIQKQQLLARVQTQAQQQIQASGTSNQTASLQISQRYQSQVRSVEAQVSQQQQQFLARFQQQYQATIVQAQQQAQGHQQAAALKVQQQEQALQAIIASICKLEGKPVPEAPQQKIVQQAGGDLPTGWVAANDDQGRIYYINTVSKTSTWTRPSQPADASGSPVGAARSAANAQVEMELSNRLSQIKFIEEQMAKQKEVLQKELMQKEAELNKIKGATAAAEADGETPVWMIDYSELEFEQKIGEGGFGDVYRAKWRGTTVAVKTLKGPHGHGDTLNPKEVEKFSKETNILRALHHPSLVLFIGACLSPRLCMVSEFMTGGSLYDLLYKRKQIPNSSRRLQLSLDIARAMAYLHQSNPAVIHRDLKSPNILLDEKFEHAKVCDVGLAKVKETSQTLTGAVGTFYWMPPEMLRGQSYTEKVDVYSFGLVLYEICVAKVPFMGMTPQQIKSRVGVQNDRPPLPSGVPSKWRELIQSCWDAEDVKRPSFINIIDTLLSMK